MELVVLSGVTVPDSEQERSERVQRSLAQAHGHLPRLIVLIG